MQSSCQTFTVVATGQNVNPTFLYMAPKNIGIRLEVKNTGATLVFIGFNNGDVAGDAGPTTATYRIPPGDTDVIVVMPEQKIYAVSAGLGGRMSVAISEVLPNLPGTASGSG